jgi:glutamine synthetase
MSKNLYLTYIWLDAFENLRSKVKILPGYSLTLLCGKPTMKELPQWTYDGSSTGQAEGHESDVILNPVSVFINPFTENGYYVLCETYNKDGTPHKTNTRRKCVETMKLAEKEDVWFGIEQEYVFFEKNGKIPYKWLNKFDPGCGGQGPYYCGVGGDRSFGREIVEEHMLLCVKAGIMICGTNAEVLPSQWEFQIGPCGGVEVSDQLWIARYILHQLTEKYNCCVSLHPKPLPNGDWNGSGCHTNMSTKAMREDGGLDEIYKACEKLSKCHKEHIEVYGKHNEMRLTGKHETASITKFSYGVGHRGCSIRIPLHVFKDKKGYLEDRRPASNMDPYLVTERLVRTICS